MSQSAIVHDGIFGFGDERQNMLVEKEFEDAAAKGFRPCTLAAHPPSLPRIPSWVTNYYTGPVCKKMNDISPNAIFLSSAFEPTHEELRAFSRSEKERSRPARERKPLLSVPSTSTSKVATSKVAQRRPPPADIVELSSDEELPDFSQILARSKKEVRFFCAALQVKNLTLYVLCPQEKPRRSTALFDDSSDDDSKSDEVKPEKSIVPSSSSQKGKQTVTNKEVKKPSQHTVATWRRGRDDDDMEPSAKMLALIEQLRAAEHAGDKTIVYSQCPSP